MAGITDRADRKTRFIASWTHWGEERIMRDEALAYEADSIVKKKNHFKSFVEASQLTGFSVTVNWLICPVEYV